MFLVNHNIPILLQTYLLSPHVHLSNAGFHLYPWTMVLKHRADAGQNHWTHLAFIGGNPTMGFFLFQSTFISNVYRCFLLANNQNWNTHDSRQNYAKLFMLSWKELEFLVSGEMPLYFPPQNKKILKRLIQLFSSQECQKNAIPPS